MERKTTAELKIASEQFEGILARKQNSQGVVTSRGKAYPLLDTHRFSISKAEIFGGRLLES